MKKYFIITVDTESDNQWDCCHAATTENAKFIPRFQALCEKFGFKPVYLTDYSMAQNPFLVEFLKKSNNNNLCEIGMHLHAWDTPPTHSLDFCSTARPYLIEYPNDVIEEKIKTIHNLLCDSFETQIVSHRAGRWAINSFYIEILEKLNYIVDCSVTPGINWKSAKGGVKGGCDYRKWNVTPTFLTKNNQILEIPVSVCNQRFCTNFRLKEIAKLFLGRKIWLRPALFSNDIMMRAIHYFENRTDYVEFMLHSSELMPGGSPYFTTQSSIENLYTRLNTFFLDLKGKGYEGVTLHEYYEIFRGKNAVL